MTEDMELTILDYVGLPEGSDLAFWTEETA